MKETQFKITEWGEIPVDWEFKKIRDFAEITTGGTPSTSYADFWGGDIRWMSSGELNLKEVYDVEGRITKKGLSHSSTKEIPPFCVLIGLAGQGKTRGTAAYNHISLCTNQSIAAIIPNKQFDSRFLYYYIDSKYTYLRAESSGEGGRGGLNKGILLSVPTVFPSLEEQHRIATALSDIDTLITSLGTLIDKKRHIKLATMQQLLTGRKRLKGFSEPWEEKKLGDIATDIRTGKRNGNENNLNGQYPFFVRSAEIYKINTYSFDGEAILIPGEGGIGKIYHYINGKFDFHQRVYKLSNFEGADAKFVYYFLILKFGKYALNNTAKATVDSLRLNIFLNFPMYVSSSVEEQRAIAQVLSDMDSDISSLEHRQAKLKAVKQGMMQQLLTGKIRLIDNQ